MRTIYHRFDDIFDWKRGRSMVYWLETRLLVQKWTKKMAFTAIRRRNSWTSVLNWTEEIQECANILLDGFYLLFEKYLQEKTSVYILKPCREIGQSFEKSLRGGKHVKNWQIFWINKNCRKMWRIMQITEDVIHLGLQPRARWITSSSICIILHLLLSLIQ